jgi:hypothetical protein
MGEQQMALKVHISPCAYEMIFDKDDSLEKCMSMGVDYMQAVKDSLNKRFSDLPMFNACNFFSPKYYPTKEETCINVCEQRLARLASKFKFLEAQRDASIGELIEFVETLRQGCENKSLLEAWKCCGNLMSGLLIGNSSCNFGKKYLLFLQVLLLLFVKGAFPNRMQ